MSDLFDFYLASRADDVKLELFEITHPDMTQPYRFCPQALDGVTVDLSPSELGVHFQYYPAEVSGEAARDDLDAEITIQLGDLGEIMPQEIDAIEEANGMLVRPSVRYWVFRSDDLTTPIYGPIALEVPVILLDEQGSALTARAPRLNANRTGELYTLSRFPMLRGFF